MIETCQTEKAKRDYMLLRKALDDNDQQAYAELMSLYRDSIYYMLVRMVKNKDDAEDLTLMTFGKAFRYLDKYTPKYAFSTWLYRIALNNSIDFLRMKNNMPQYFEEDLYTSSTTSIILIAVRRPSPVFARRPKMMCPDCSPPSKCPLARMFSATYLSPTAVFS